MSNVTVILATLALVLAVATLFIAAMMHRKRAIEEAGYRRVDVADDRIAATARTIFGREPSEVYARDERDGESWLLFLRTADKGRPNCVMLVRSFKGKEWPSLALVKTGGKADDFIAGMQAMDLADLKGDWRVYREAGRDLPAPLAAWLPRLVQQGGLNRLHGIALRGPYLMAWTDPRRINVLIAAGAKLAARMAEAPRG